MKRILIISLISFLGLPFTPWWMLWIALAVCGYFINTYGDALGTGAAAASLPWGIKLGIGYLNGGAILLNRVAEMMNLGSSFGLILVSLILAGTLGALSALSGYKLKNLINPPISNTQEY